jgi:hypothetical protein
MGSDGKPKEIPGLILENREDARRFLEAIKRKELKKNYKEELNNQKTRIAVDKELPKLEHERCIIKDL